jgi:opacity protein-like surface antigen
MKTYLLLALMALALTAQSAFALSGKTADGCTYRIINGQYLTNCGGRTGKPVPQAAAPAPAPQPTQQVAQAEPVANDYSEISDYGDVPLRSRGPAPSNAPVIHVHPSAPQAAVPAIVHEEDYDTQRKRQHDVFVDSAYVGTSLSSTSVGDAGSSTGIGFNLGTNVDDHFAFELGYNYSSVSLALGAKGAGALNTYTRPDASLKTHLFSGEVQGHLTDTFKRLRPYLGLGLGWKSSTLQELNTAQDYGVTRSGTLSQSSLGGLGSVGAKFRVAKALQIGLSFRYFLPLASKDAELKSARTEMGVADTRLSKADDGLTSSGLSQISGGITYNF